MKVAAVRGIGPLPKGYSPSVFAPVALKLREALRDIAEWLNLEPSEYCFKLEEEGPFIWERVDARR